MWKTYLGWFGLWVWLFFPLEAFNFFLNKMFWRHRNCIANWTRPLSDLSEARLTIPWERIYKPSFSSGYKTMEGSIKFMTRHWCSGNWFLGKTEHPQTPLQWLAVLHAIRTSWRGTFPLLQARSNFFKSLLIIQPWRNLNMNVDSW